ncbi:hypothetical protein [Cryptosporangium phraense]|uniref:Uncharacterized protein n=1 Tax=Cryptosporangium phraense TaxID=2593070 RepID=A0A545APV8_9ACTN|nr:hypothetical protein [Cryptosporangium phraense]TQS43367.1 hypothetical protein FL583_19230 [Cryptosporangium phraense]
MVGPPHHYLALAEQAHAALIASRALSAQLHRSVSRSGELVSWAARLAATGYRLADQVMAVRDHPHSSRARSGDLAEQGDWRPWSPTRCTADHPLRAGQVLRGWTSTGR